MKGLSLRDERGIAVLLMALIMIPLLLAVMAGSSTFVTSVTSADVDMQEAVAFACKAAALNVVQAAQARGEIRIDSARAHAAFRDTLARNMGLNTATLRPLSNSLCASSPRYWLVVYNGYNDFKGAFGARYYCFDGRTVSESPFPYTGFPAFFAVSQTGITSGKGGVFTVCLETPGVVALVECEAKRIIGDIRGTKSIKAQR